MTVIIKLPEKKLWETICKESEYPEEPPKDKDEIEYINYDPSVHHPAFYGHLHVHVDPHDNLAADFDPSISHPACIGYYLIDIPETQAELSPPPAPDKKTCLPRVFVEFYILPILEPALIEMLKQAKLEKCFERKKTRFNACDYLTEYLYKKNPNHTERENMKLDDIPFVKEWLKTHPRPQLPKSLLWTEDEAAVVIQSHWRGYLDRRTSEIQELRQWQREWHEERHGQGIKGIINNFWNNKMPNWQRSTPSDLEEISSTATSPDIPT